MKLYHLQSQNVYFDLDTITSIAGYDGYAYINTHPMLRVTSDELKDILTHLTIVNAPKQVNSVPTFKVGDLVTYSAPAFVGDTFIVMGVMNNMITVQNLSNHLELCRAADSFELTIDNE